MPFPVVLVYVLIMKIFCEFFYYCNILNISILLKVEFSKDVMSIFLSSIYTGLLLEV